MNRLLAAARMALGDSPVAGAVSLRNVMKEAVKSRMGAKAGRMHSWSSQDPGVVVPGSTAHLAQSFALHPGVPEAKALSPEAREAANSYLSAREEDGLKVAEAATDGFHHIGSRLTDIAQSLKKVAEAEHPVLASVAHYYFDLKGKSVRPTLVLAMTDAVRGLDSSPTMPPRGVSMDFDGYRQLDASVVLPHGFGKGWSSSDGGEKGVTKAPDPWCPNTGSIENEDQVARRLAEITELIHAASLVHDDVVDESSMRRGSLSAPARFGNKISVLGGDFMLSRAALSLSQIHDPRITQVVSLAIANLVEGEVMQVASSGQEMTMNQYLLKSYCKTASLLANSCLGASFIPADYSREKSEAAFLFGKHLGLCFQIVDDNLDYTQDEKTLGKPACADLANGHITAPALFAAKNNDRARVMVKEGKWDPTRVAEMKELVLAYGMEDAQNLAREHHDIAVSCLAALPASKSRDALQHLAHSVLTRDH